MGCLKKKDKRKATNIEDLKKEVEMDEHKIPLEELLKRLESNKTEGLSDAVAAERLKTNGPNALTPPNKKSVFRELCEHLFGGFNMLLWGAAIFSFLGYGIEYLDADEAPSPDNMYMGIILLVVVTLTGTFSFWQNRTSANIMASFANMIPTTAHVIRNGNFVDIKVEDVVIGDLVTFSGGDKIPADVRVIDSKGLKVDNSSLTGESEPQTRTAEFTHENPYETKNLCMFSTNVIEGTATGIVVKTGDKTIMGRIAALTSQVSSGTTPIAKEIHHFILVIGFVAFTVAMTCLIISLVNGAPVIEAIVFMMGIFVANVPEGTTATVTACLTLTAKKMRRKFCLVKNLEAVETLGSTSTICSDKTGTLTQNRMTVTHIWVNNGIEDAVRSTEDGKKEGKDLPVEGSFSDLLRCATLCSRSDFKNDDRTIALSKRETVGDASEVAILKYCELVHTNGVATDSGVREYRKKLPKVCEIPFNSNNKYQVSIHERESDHLLVMKGAPEKILSLCTTISINNETVEVTKEIKDQFQKAYERLGGFGERVLGFCDFALDQGKYPKGHVFDSENPNFPLTGLRFVGLISLIDPPRPGVPMAVRLCQSAGIKVVMVTGDHPITAQAIAKQVHIIEDKSTVTELVEDDANAPPNELFGIGRLKDTDAIVVHGEQLRKLSESTLDSIVQSYPQVVFARTSPTQKLQIVEAYQRCHQVVAVTGDGVNDAPALRKADIGIAMGIAGTDVSKQAADMILLNDNFASIVTGVEEGRIIFDNLKKSIAYVLTSNIGEVTPFISHVIFGIPLPMSLICILMIDMGTDLWPAISLAYEQPESDIMQRPPRDARYDKLVTSRLIIYSYLHIGVIQAFAGFTAYFSTMIYHGFHPWDLMFRRDEWENAHFDGVTDSFGQQWPYSARKDLEHSCHAAFFFTMVMVQWADLFISKTRKNSIVVQGVENKVMNFGMLSTVILSSVFLYTPFVNRVLGVVGLRATTTIVGMPFALIIFMYDEIRKFFIRRWPGGFVYRQTNY